jgi:hypothetical protein
MPRHHQSTVLGPRSRTFVAVAIATLAGAWATDANAVSLRVKLACSRDYYALCSQYSSDSPEVRHCMRAAGEKLSPRCVSALIAEGEVSEAEVSRRAAQLRQ